MRSVDDSSPPRVGMRVVGAVALAIVATVLGVAAFGEMFLAGLEWGTNGLVRTSAWNVESPFGVALGFVYLVTAAALLGASVYICLRAPRRRLAGLAIGICITSPLVVLIGGALALAPPSFWL